MPIITLPDGSQRSFDHPVTVAEVAQSIGAGLAKAALAGKLDGQLVDTSYLIDKDAGLAIITEKSEEALEIIRHSCAHLLAQAVQRLYPDAQVTIGPVIEDGFYYDFSYPKGFTPDDLVKIESEMEKIVKEDLPITRSVMPRNDCFFQKQGRRIQSQNHRRYSRRSNSVFIPARRVHRFMPWPAFAAHRFI